MLSFVFQNPEAGKRIKSIYLFGSAVRGTLEKKSDVDLFIECEKDDETRVKQLTDSGIVKFTSSKEYEKWKLFHFVYPFSVQIGQLAEWELKLSIASEGISLYNRENLLTIGDRKVLFIIMYPAEKKDYIKIRRLLFGRDEKYYQGTGLVHQFKGKKFSSNVFMLPKQHQNSMINALSKAKVDFTMREIQIFE